MNLCTSHLQLHFPLLENGDCLEPLPRTKLRFSIMQGNESLNNSSIIIMLIGGTHVYHLIIPVSVKKVSIKADFTVNISYSPSNSFIIFF